MRFKEQKVYFDGLPARFSDRNFLLIPGEEPDRHIRRPLHQHDAASCLLVADAGRRTAVFMENDPKYGKVYHISTADDELKYAEKKLSTV